MEKLIELIIQFQKEIWQTTYDLDRYHYDNKLKLIIIWSDVSKWFIDYIDIFRLLFAPWFIKWLVENDKIKDNGIKPRTDLVKEIQIVDYETGKSLWWKNQYSETEQLIMCLSIQDNPLEYLCSILK